MPTGKLIEVREDDGSGVPVRQQQPATDPALAEVVEGLVDLVQRVGARDQLVELSRPRR